MQNYTSKYVSSFSLLMFRIIANWFTPKMVQEWIIPSGLEDSMPSFISGCIFLTKFKSPEKKYIKEKTSLYSQESNIPRGCYGKRRPALKWVCSWHLVSTETMLPLRIWSSSGYDEVMAVPVSLGHALSAHSFSFSSLRRCCQQVILRESCYRELTNPKFQIPENTGPAFGGLDIKQHR